MRIPYSNASSFTLPILFLVVASMITCQKNFFFDEDLQVCVASCQTWSQYGEVTTTALRATVITSNCVGILLAVTALIVSVIRHKSM